jgi:hypothetical protein
MLDKSKPADLCIGGVLSGCLMQGGRFYREGVEVDKDNVPVPGAKAPKEPKGKKVDNTDMSAFVDPQVAAQLGQS